MSPWPLCGPAWRPWRTTSSTQGGDDPEDFYRAKLATAEFYYERLLPRAQTHATSMLSPSKNLMQLDADHMGFIDEGASGQP